MLRCLTTPNLSGFLDLKTNVVVLTKYKAADKACIDRCLNHDPAIKRSVNDAISDLKIKATVVHEVTHFLDFTTTMWGLEYIVRKMSLIDRIQAGEIFKPALDTFMVNVAELDMHQDLVVIDPGVSLESCVMSHELKYTDRYGPIIMIYYSRGDMRCHEVPLSMLSVLEANAFANQFLSKLCDIELIDDQNAKLKAREIVRQQFDDYLHEPTYSEYTVVLYLARLHFPDLDLRELLVFISTLVRFTLDLRGVEMSIMSDVIAKTFKNQRIGNSISMDMKRGTSRHLVTLKTILMMHGWHNAITALEKKNHILMIKTDPMSSIKHFWEQLGIKFESEMTELEFNFSIETLNNSKSLRDKDIVNMSCEANRALVQTKMPGLLQLRDLKLLDIMLNDNTPITMPNRMDIDVVDYCENHITLLNDLDRVCKAEKASKFHIHPDTPQFFII